MAEIKPFRMVRYNGELERELPRLISPPYDVISPAEQEFFYQEHPLNIIRLVLNKKEPDDGPENNRYTRAAATLQEWMQNRTLVRADRPGFVVYSMAFEQPGGGRQRIDGIVGLVKVDDYGKGKVLPHEKTYLGPKQDQLNLMRACKGNLTPIHALFDDETNRVMQACRSLMQERPEQEACDGNGTIHRTWSLTDPEILEEISGFLRDKSLFIADGHHRYETAWAFRDEMRAAGNNDPDAPHEYVMMYLTSLSHPGLTILPAHRLIKGLKEVNIPLIQKVLDPYFEIEDLCYGPGDRTKVAQTMVDRIRSYSNVGGKFGMAVQGDNCFRLLRLKDFQAIDALMDADIPSTLRGLDVTILREIILAHGLGLDRDNSEEQIEYTPLVSEALDRVLNGEIQVSFILNPTRVDQMRVAAELGHKLPHKSTYFFPKLSSGLVLNVF